MKRVGSVWSMVASVSVFLFVSTVSSIGVAASYYIRAGATGNASGSNWTDAFPDFAAAGLDGEASVSARGNVYYVAAGLYGDISLDNDVQGDQLITIRKATANDHGTASDWDPSYAQQAWFSSIAFRSQYWVFDGRISGGDDPNGYGFRVVPSDCDQEVRAVGMPPLGAHSKQVDYINFSHTAMEMCGAGEFTQIGIYSNAFVHGATHMTIADNYFYGGNTNILIRNWSDAVIENNYFDGNWSSSENHGEQISPGNHCVDIVVRGNVFVDSTIFVIGVHKDHNERWQLYNNLVIGGNGISALFTAVDHDGGVMGAWDVHHNTFVGISEGMGLGILSNGEDGGSSPSFAYNNLSFQLRHPTFGAGVVHDYNAFYDCTGTVPTEAHGQVETTDPFVAADSGDYHLSNPTEAGKDDLDSVYDTDKDGVLRQHPDRGAFEFFEEATGGGGTGMAGAGGAGHGSGGGTSLAAGGAAAVGGSQQVSLQPPTELDSQTGCACRFMSKPAPGIGWGLAMFALVIGRLREVRRSVRTSRGPYRRKSS